jgi:pSer/pThr/pTyr-binding forkhead associated (FHA) protein
MPETIFSWYTRFVEDPKKVATLIGGRPVLMYVPAEVPSDDEDDDYQVRTQSGLESETMGGGEEMAVIVEKTKDNAFRSRVTIGRTANNDIVLDDASVSRFHAWLQVDGAAWQVFDAGSRNGTQVNGTRIVAKKGTALANGTRVKVGSVELIFHSAQGFLDLLKKKAQE